MGKEWDGGDISFNPEMWAMLAEHLYDGAFGMAFASSRGWHRLACAIEDAGLIIHPSIFGWAFGSGFPKATRIDTQIDKAAQATRAVVGKSNSGMVRVNRRNAELGYRASDYAEAHTQNVTAPATELAATWAGHRYGLQALKPALEPIIVFQKPYSGKPVDCITRTGAGALNIDGTRIAGANGDGHWTHAREIGNGIVYQRGGNTGEEFGNVNPASGRWAANLILSHHPDCVRVGTRKVKGSPTSKSFHDSYAGESITGFIRGVSHPGNQHADADGNETIESWECVDGCAVKQMGEQSGELTSGLLKAGTRRNSRSVDYGKMPDVAALRDFGNDTGTAARFFFNSDWSYEVAEQLANADPVRYQAKASRSERDAGLERFQEIKTTRYKEQGQGHLPKQTPRKAVSQHNPHPTVKPIRLTEYLARLLLPPSAYAPRRILVPFAGVGSEMIGAALAGWDVVVGVEQDVEYCEIAEARLKYWIGQNTQPTLGL